VDFDEVWERVTSATELKTQSDLADFLGLRQATISDYKKKNQFNANWAIKICDKFSLSVHWLLTGEGPKGREFLVMDRREPYAPEDASLYVYVPRYDVRAAAGPGMDIQSEYIVDYLAFKKEWIHSRLHVSPQNLVLINVSGDSMEPALYDDDLILVDTGVTDYKNDALYVLNLGGELQVKRIQYVPGGDLVIKSDNPYYGSFTAKGDQKEFLIIVGQVVWFGRQI